MRMIQGMRVRCFYITLGLQSFILSMSLRKIDKYEIVSYVSDWLNCSTFDALRIVESVLGVCTNESDKINSN